MSSNKTYLSEADFIAGVTLRPVSFDVPDVGTVSIRGLSSLELSDLQHEYKDKPVMMMLKAVELCLVEPKLSAKGVEALQRGHPGVVQALSKRILELSGQGEALEQDPLAGSGS